LPESYESCSAEQNPHHGRLGAALHVIEVTPEKKVVWTFADHRTMKTIATIQLLDVPGGVTRGEILH
jgi:hypothetical protein